MATSIQSCALNVKITMSSRSSYYDVAPTLCQLCQERKERTIHGDMIAFSQTCFKVVKNFNNNIMFVWMHCR